MLPVYMATSELIDLNHQSSYLERRVDMHLIATVTLARWRVNS